MKTIKKVTALLLSMVLFFSFVTTYVLADDDVSHATIAYQCIRSDGERAANFYIDGSVIESYAEAGGSLNSTQSWFVNARTYVENFFPEEDVHYGLYQSLAYVNLDVYCEHGNITSREDIMWCDPDDDMAYAWIRANGSSDGCLIDFLTEHMLYGGIPLYDEIDSQHFWQYADTETILIFTDPNYPRT